MLKITLVVLLIVAGAFLLVYLFWPQKRVPASVVSAGNFAKLEEQFEDLINGKPPRSALIIDLESTGDFLQFSCHEGAVEIDAPLITDEQKERETEFRRICADLGLTIREVEGSDGSRFLDADAGSDPAELARITEIFLSRLFDADENTGLKFTLHPWPE